MTFRKLFLFVFLSLGIISFIHSKVFAIAYEVSIATFTGDFKEGGEYESSERLLGNASNFALGFLQGNLVRIFIASGTSNMMYAPLKSTPTTAGFVGIWTDGVKQIPQHHLDVWGRLRSTDTALLATHGGSVCIGGSSATSNSKLEVIGLLKADGSLIYNISTGSLANAFAVATDTTTLNTKLITFVNFRSTTDTSLTNFVNFRSTTDISILNLQIRSSTNDVAITNLQIRNSTSDANLNLLNTYMSTNTIYIDLAISTNTKGLFISSNTPGGLTAGNYTNTDLTVDINGRIVKAANGTGGGGGGADTNFRTATVYLSSSGALSTGSDVQSSLSTGLVKALELIGAAGLTNSTTAQGTIIMGAGIYDWSNVTIPAGITIWMLPGSSVVIRPIGDSTIATIYGKIYNGYTDIQNNYIANSEIYKLKTGSRIDGMTVYGAGNFNQDASVNTIFSITDSSDVYLHAKMLDGSPTAQDGHNGGLLTVNRSSDCYVNLDVKNPTVGTTNGKQHISFTGCRNIYVTGKYYGVGARVFYMAAGNSELTFDKLDMFLSYPTANYSGFFSIRATVVGYNSESNSTIKNCLIRNNSGDANQVIFFYGGTQDVFGWTIENNKYIGFPGTVATFIYIYDLDVNKTIIHGNQVYNATFINDAGTGTVYTGQGNFLAGVEQ